MEFSDSHKIQIQTNAGRKKEPNNGVKVGKLLLCIGQLTEKKKRFNLIPFPCSSRNGFTTPNNFNPCHVNCKFVAESTYEGGRVTGGGGGGLVIPGALIMYDGVIGLSILRFVVQLSNWIGGNDGQAASFSSPELYSTTSPWNILNARIQHQQWTM